MSFKYWSLETLVIKSLLTDLPLSEMFLIIIIISCAWLFYAWCLLQVPAWILDQKKDPLDSCGLPSGFCESNPGLLKELTELLTTEPSQVTTERFFKHIE